ncbi:hypothetical protein [Actinacidiphila acididurans]|uniref:Zinc-finger domain-containing protein n=1 Tax=Actinacidiphila acididurans TaxID=2784346 RepID=A0ABS2TXL8_9ACTN|nr:hypothetical protein [Actinacidiphila acididurans]MBM9508097.1 hypothetical protein [Actinacidiphila acididurans]
MAGPVNSPCRDVRPVLAECLLLGTPLPSAASRHLADCADCAREAAELTDVVRTLRRAVPVPPAAGFTPSEPVPVAPPPGLAHQVRTGVARARRARTRRRRVTVGAAVALAAAAAVLVPVTTGARPAPAPAAVAVTREGRMVPHTWGTEVPVLLTGLHPGRTYRLMTADASGHRLPGGSVQAPPDRAVRARIVTAMPRRAITALLVEDETGHVVARVPVTPPPASEPA